MESGLYILKVSREKEGRFHGMQVAQVCRDMCTGAGNRDFYRGNLSCGGAPVFGGVSADYLRVCLSS